MGLEKVIEDILRKGEEQRSEIIRQGERERDEQVSLADKQVDENRRKAELRSKVQVAQMEQQELSSAELESKKTMLSAQRQIMGISGLTRSPTSHRTRTRSGRPCTRS